ncbi:MAG: hypothetical protein ACJ77N_17035, partial [Chloroflexota bacterium]
MTQRIVILGGGFAGVSTAEELTKRLRRQHRLLAPGDRTNDRGSTNPGTAPEPVSVTLISRENYFVFQPLLADVISGSI